MAKHEAELEMVQRHVRSGAVHVAHQHQIVARFLAKGIPAELAQKVLATLIDVQIEHEAHLKRLLLKKGKKL